MITFTIHKNIPLSEKQAKEIRFDIEELLTSNVNRYYKSKYCQKIKIEANTSTDDSNTFFRLNGLKKQLEKCNALLRQKENNIKKTIETQIDNERKSIKKDYDIFKACKESEYNNCLVDMQQKLYLFKHQLEDQHKSHLDDLERQYKSCILTLEKTMIEKDREIGKLSTTISQTKKDKNTLKKDFASAKKTIKVLDDIIYSKDQTIISYNEGLQRINLG
ncbi:1649_t:CDS:1, partial [Funneliformis geosporum]